MNPEISDLLQQGRALLTGMETLLFSLSRPRQLWQVGGVLVLFTAAYLLALWIRPRLHNWLRDREAWPMWRMRVALVILQRIRLILFVVLIHASVQFVALVSPWPSARFVLTLVASVATAWLLVALATRLIRNRVIRRLVSWGAWIWVTLYYLRLVDETETLLDSIAIHLGDVRLSLLMLIQAIVLTASLLVLAKFLTRLTADRVGRNDEIAPTMQVLLVKVSQIIFFGLAFVIGMRVVGVDLTGLAVLSGAIGVGLGFGLQKVVSNLVSGVIILLDKSIKPGDVISLGETFGWINQLGARYVSITTRDGKEYLIPNEDLITTQVVNWSHSNEFVRLDIFFGTAYDDDPHLVRKVAISAALGVDRVLRDRAPVCHIVGFGDSSVDYILRFWIKDPTAGLTNIRGNVYLALWDAFKAEGISIPFPQREVRILGRELIVSSDPVGMNAPARASESLD